MMLMKHFKICMIMLMVLQTSLQTFGIIKYFLLKINKQFNNKLMIRKLVATEFKDFDNVIAYELLNEPWFGVNIFIYF